MIYLGLVIYCALLFIRPADWVPGILNWPLEFVAIGVTASAALVKRFVMGEWDSSSRPWLLLFALLWIGTIFLSDVVHGDLGFTIETTVKYGKLLIITMMFWAAVDSPRKLRWLIVLLVLLAAILALQGIYQKQHGVGWAGQKLYWAGRICWVGLWNGANVLSLVFVSSFPFLLEMILGPWRFAAKVFAGAAGATILVALFYAASRGAWLSLAVVLMIYFLKRMGWIGGVVGLVAIAGLVALAPSRMSHLGMGSSSADDKSAEGRINEWYNGLQMVKHNPVLGIGKMRWQFEHHLVAHNTFVQNMGETGYVGLFAWVGLIYISFRRLLAVLRHKEDLDPGLVSMTRATLFSLTGYMATSFFITADFDLFYVLIGLCAAVWAVAGKESPVALPFEFTWKDARNIAMIELAGTALIYTVVRVSG